VTSWNELRRDGLAVDRHNLLHPDGEQRTAYVTQRLQGRPGPVVAVSDWMRAVQDQISEWVPQEFTSLGTDGWGMSDTRGALRRHFDGGHRAQFAAAGGAEVLILVDVFGATPCNAALAAATTYSWNGQTGHLVTVTSLAENNFIYSAFVGPRFATPGANVEQATPWLALSDRETEGLWKWMAGPEAGTVASFTNWNNGEPNNLGNEDYTVLHWQNRGLGTGRWYDYGALGYGGQTFVVEFENAVNPAPVPVPATLPLLASALAGFGVWRRRAVGRT
jgi:hypothetical protein